jgi:hypothetical protein
MVSFSIPRAVRRWAANKAFRRKKLPYLFALHSPTNVLERLGDNCLLTRDSAYVDLSFSRLIA